MSRARPSFGPAALRALRLVLVGCLLGGAACGNETPADGAGNTTGGTGGVPAGAGGTTGATGGIAMGGAVATGGVPSGGGTAGVGAGTTPGGSTAGGAAGSSAAGASPGGTDAGVGGAGGANGGGSGMPGGGGNAGVAGTGMGGAGMAGSSGAGGSAGRGFPQNPTPVVLTDDAGYCWFEDPRALFHGERLIIGSVASGWLTAARRGDIEAVVYDFATSRASVVELHNALELDDHDSAAFLVRPDGKLLALYARHLGESRFYYRVSTADTLLSWSAERTFAPSSGTVTYSNLFRLTAENDRIYDFHRGSTDSYKPTYAYSDDQGETWRNGNVVINVPSTQNHRPYVRYATNGTDTIHIVYTEAHPRDFANSLYHVFYRGGSLYRSDGTSIRSLTQGLSSPDEGTRIFQGNADNVAWCADAALDASGRPVAAYSVQVGSAGLPVGQGGDDIRYRYARWDGSAWRDYALAYAGRRLYSGEDDYSGLVAIDPADVNTVFISTNANPSTGAPLTSAADGARHYEIFRGTTANAGQTWQWTSVTRDSRVDNLRPIVPRPGPGGRRALIWLRGTYRSYTDYQQELVAVLWND